MFATVPRQRFPWLVVAVLLLSVMPTPMPAQEHAPITRQLQALIEAQPKVGELLAQSIDAAAEVNPDPATNPVRTLSDYFGFVDELSKLVPRQIVANPPDQIRDQILQTACYFYFLVDQPLDALKDQGLFKNAIQYHAPFADWLRDFVTAWGAFLDTDASWNQATYQQFLADPSYGLMRDWYEPPTRWTTFNQFFARQLRDPSARPIASPDDPSVVVAPADSVPQGVWPIDAQSRIRVEGGLGVKLARFFSIPELLGPDSAYGEAFAGGVLTHTFLNVNDYHRYHFAVGGTIKEIKQIRQFVALEVSWNPETRRYDPVDSTGWQFSQTRGVVIVDTGDHGLVALIPMGMAMVSSVNFAPGVEVGNTHGKGDMLGHFLFGGSDFVMVFQRRAGFELTAAKDRGNPDAYAHLLMGEAYGKLTGAGD